MIANVDFRALPIVYRMNDIKDVGVTAYVKGFADWFFSSSLQHVAVSEKGNDYDHRMRFNADLKTVSRGVWALQRAVALIAFPILLVAKMVCSRDTSYTFVIEEDGTVTNEVKLKPEAKRLYQTVRYGRYENGSYTVKDENGKIVEKSEANGYTSAGAYDVNGRLVNGTIYDSSRNLVASGVFTYNVDTILVTNDQTSITTEYDSKTAPWIARES